MNIELVRTKGCVVSDLRNLEAANYKFGTIYADPPWQYGNQGTRAATNNHYATMTPKEIASLPVECIAAEQSHLHLWTTNAFLFECPKIMEAWGFEYKGVFVWVKPQMGIGNYWRVSHEFLILGVRGKLTFEDANYPSWIETPRTKHSQKPPEIRRMIEKTSPEPRLELFGRDTTPGWIVWGNEINRTLFNEEAFANECL
jgi:N6-adenosine-specific RNA methylase IME4